MHSPIHSSLLYKWLYVVHYCTLFAATSFQLQKHLQPAHQEFSAANLAERSVLERVTLPLSVDSKIIKRVDFLVDHHSDALFSACNIDFLFFRLLIGITLLKLFRISILIWPHNCKKKPYLNQVVRGQ